MDATNPIKEQFDALERACFKRGYLTAHMHTAAVIALVCAILLLAGCTTIDTHKAPPADWPMLKITVVNVDSAWKPCARYAGFGTIPMACAEIRFDLGTCVIYTTSERHMEHELYHCRGFDHEGDTTLADAWEAYRGRK